MPRRARQPDPAPASTDHAAAEAREIEWQLAAPDLAGVRSWLSQHTVLDDLRIAPLPAQQLHDTYLDTDDWRLFRAGFALRLREKEGGVEATLKGLHSARGDVADRREISQPLPRGSPKALALANGPVGNRVRDVAGIKPFRILFEVRTLRQRFAVRRRKPAPAVGEIALDEARFSRGNGHRRPLVLTRVELEVAGPDQAPLERLALQLRTECGLHPARENKFAVGLRSASLDPPRLPGPGEKAGALRTALAGSACADEFAAKALIRLLGEWRAQEPAARLGERPEALHALRVAARRMDAVLSLFRAYLPAAVGRSRPTLKGLLDAMGAVRDVDIRVEAVGRFRASCAEGDRGALDPLLRQLESERAAARAAMLRALDSKSARQWLEALPGKLARAAPAPGPGSAGSRRATVSTALPALIRKRYRKLRKRARRLTPESSLLEHHGVRIRAKKLRYALEIVAATYGQPAAEMLAALQKLQSRLGAQHDAGAVADYLTQLAARPPADFAPRTLFMMGRMAELQARDAARLAGDFRKPWRKVRGKRWRALRARMQHLRNRASAKGSAANGRDRRARALENLAEGSGRAATRAAREH